MAPKITTLDDIMNLGYLDGPAIDCEATQNGTMVEVQRQDLKYSISLADYIVGTNKMPASVNFHTDDKKLIKTALEKDLFYFTNKRKINRGMIAGNSIATGAVVGFLTAPYICLPICAVFSLIAVSYALSETDREMLTKYYLQNKC